MNIERADFVNQITLPAPADQIPHVEISLGFRNGRRIVTLVDAEDVPLLRGRRWYWMTRKGRSGYAISASCVGGKKAMVLMHRLILGLEKGDPVQADHRNSNGLDNRRANLRLATKAENLRNRRKITGESGFKGVYPTKRGGARPFFAMCARQYLGRFATAVEAAIAYDKCAKERYGEFAATNAEILGGLA